MNDGSPHRSDANDGAPDWRRTLAVLFFAQLLSAVGFSMIFPFLPTYVASLGSAWGLNLVFLAGAVFSAQAITMTAASPFWGAIADRVGRKPMVLRALYGGSLVILAMGFVTNAETLVALRALQGVITGVVSAASALVVAATPRARSGFALGALQTALTAGVAAGPVLGGVMADLLGYRAAFVATAGLMAIGGVAVHALVREAFTRPATPRPLRAMGGEWLHVLRAPGVGTTFAARFVAWLGRGVMVPILPLFVPFLLLGSGREATFTGLVIGVSAATSTLSALALGALGDRIGHKPILVVSAAVAAACYLPMAFVTAPWQLLALSATAGVAVGGIMPSLSALLSGATEQTEVGSAFGLDNAVISASRAVAPILGVGLAALLGGGEFGYRSVFLMAGVLFLVTVAIAAGLRTTPAGAPLRPRVSGD